MNTLNQLRLREAARYLVFTSRLVGDIARDVGFADPFFFTRQFTAFFGVSPSAYRAREQEREQARQQ
jgi:AraC family transcriptional regulator of arabinose operon